MYKVGQIERLIQDEEAAREGVAHLELGVFGLLNDELLMAKVMEGATAVGLP